jgi:ParB-like chromosome segregation protein Spo0J
MRVHRLAKYFPILEGEEFDALVGDIKKNGQLEPIVLFDDQVLDGVNRYNACKKLGVEPKVKTFKGRDPLSYVISVNIRRRHLNPSQKAALAVELLPEFEAEARERRAHRQSAESLPTDSHGYASASVQAANSVGVSGRSVDRAKRVKETDTKLFDEVVQGKKSVDAADEEIHRTVKKDEKAVAKRELERLTEGQEMRMIAKLGKILLMAHDLQPFVLMSPKGRQECTRLAERIKQELDTKIETAEAEWEEKHG